MMFHLGMALLLRRKKNLVTNVRNRETDTKMCGLKETRIHIKGTERENGCERTQISLNLQSLPCSNDDE